MNEVRAKTETASATSSEKEVNGRVSASSGSNSGGNNGSSGSSRANRQHHHNHHYPYGHFMKWGGDREQEDESIHYLSEPSLSEEGDSTADQNDRSLLSDGDDDTDDRATPPPPPPGAPPPRNQSQSSAASTTVASPGNTSLSSWESHFRPRHPNHRVRIHFSPETTSERHHAPYNSSPYYQHQAQHLFPPQNSERSSEPTQQRQPQQPDVLDSAQQHRNSGGSNNDMSYSTFSMSNMSSVDAKERKKLDEFIHGLRQSSEGALQESAGNVSLLNTSIDSATSELREHAGVDTVLRINTDLSPEQQAPEIPSPRTHRRISSVETELIGNTSDAFNDEKDNDPERQQPAHTIDDDSPLMLNLSVLGDEDPEFSAEGEPNSNATTPTSKGGRKYSPDEDNHTTTTDEGHADDDHSDHHHHCADDEQTEFRPPRRRVFKVAGAKPSPVHRRTRSGDSAAAALATGGTDWIGMFKAGIPMPDGDDDDEYDEDDNAKDGKLGSPEKLEQDLDSARNRNGTSPSKKKQANCNEKAVFALGAAETPASRTAARKQRRETRQQQRAMAEKAAAAARQKRIKKQYQQWSQSPLWAVQNQQQNVSQGMDSSETNSLGSVPSTVGLKFSPGNAIAISTRSNLTHSSGDEGAPHPRNSLDTASSGMSTAAEPIGAPRRGNSIGSHHSFFSWISASHHDAAGDQLDSSPLPRSQQPATLKVFPNWSPQSAALASPVVHQRKLGQPQQYAQRHSFRTQSPSDINSSTRSEQEAFMRYSLPNERMNQSERSMPQEAFMRYSLPNETVNQSSRSERSMPQEAFMRYMQQQQQQQQTTSERDSFRRYAQAAISPHNSVVFAGVPPNFPTPPLMSSKSQGHHFTYSQHSRSGSSSRSSGNSSSSSSSSSSSGSEVDDDEFMSVSRNRVPQIHPNTSIRNLDEAEQSAENELLKRGSCQHVLRGGQTQRQLSPFANFGRKISGVGPGPKKFDRASFLPKTSVMEGNEVDYPTYRCPRCQTIQREFFTVDSAPRQYETASGFLALSFVVYVIASLYIFGLEEGWPALDCIYFAVITLTTAGLGDFVPTSNFNKIICSIFIYFGVACIGLLLGSYIAAMLDESTRRQARENRISACPNCARLQNIKDAAERRALATAAHAFVPNSLPMKKFSSERSTFHHPTKPFAFEDSSELDFSSDDGYQLGNKKIKRRHDSCELPTMNSPPLSLSHTKTTGSAGEASPFTTTSKSSITSLHRVPSTMDKIPEESDATTPEVKVETVDLKGPPPLITNNSHAKTSGLSRSPVSPATPRQTQPATRDLLGSPMTKQILGRQSHTRHESIDLNGKHASMGSIHDLMGGGPAIPTRKYSHDAPQMLQTPTIVENVPFVPGTSGSMPKPQTPGVRFEQDESMYSEGDMYSSDASSVGSSGTYSSEESDILTTAKDRVRTAKYVFLTLKQALVNSLVIIAAGCLGFWFIESFTLVDSWYFTTVLLTTVGYGDIVPVTKGGKLFATIYILVAGTILLNNMSLISMIPLELRKRRIERAVLTQFGDLLDDDALRELASGPLIQRLRLSRSRADGLNECTREMFALAMLVRLGKVTEEDIAQTFGAFNRLDVNRDGVLNSKSIIAGMIRKSRSSVNLPGMGRRVSSSSNLLKTPAPMYGASQDNGFAPRISPSVFAPPPAYEAPNTMYHATGGTNETSSLLHNNRGYSSMLSRSS